MSITFFAVEAWIDENGSGTRDAEDKPLEGVRFRWESENLGTHYLATDETGYDMLRLSGCCGGQLFPETPAGYRLTNAQDECVTRQAFPGCVSYGFAPIDSAGHPATIESPTATAGERARSEEATAFYNLGKAYFEEGQFEKAAASFDKAIQLKSDYAEALSYQGRSYNAKGNHDLALAACNRAIRLRPDLAEAYLCRGNVHADEGNYDEAIAEYDRAIQLRPDFTQAHNNRGYAYYIKGDLDNAFAGYDRAIETDPRNVWAYGNRGRAYYDRGDYNRALADYDRAIELAPDYAGAYALRGYVHVTLGNKAVAIADFRQVLELSDDPVLTARAKEELQKLGAPVQPALTDE